VLIPESAMTARARLVLLGSLGLAALGLASCEDRDPNNPFAGANGDARTTPYGDGPSGTSSAPMPPEEPGTVTHSVGR
jgi:hypothetical protein